MVIRMEVSGKVLAQKLGLCFWSSKTRASVEKNWGEMYKLRFTKISLPEREK